MNAKWPSLILTVDQDDQEKSEDDGVRRERALLVLSSLAIDALDELSGLSKVCRHDDIVRTAAFGISASCPAS